jgi:hypothetical protein
VVEMQGSLEPQEVAPLAVTSNTGGGGQRRNQNKTQKLRRLTQNAVTVTQNAVAITQYAVAVAVAVFFHSGRRRDHSEAEAQV